LKALYNKISNLHTKVTNLGYGSQRDVVEEPSLL